MRMLPTRIYEHARAALSALPTGWRETMQWSGIDGEAFPLQAEEYAGDNPSYNQSLNGPDKKAWAEARRAEIDNLHNHCAYEEVPEDSLPTWDSTCGTATEVVNTLWVQVKKRGKDGDVVKFKGRCVYTMAELRNQRLRPKARSSTPTRRVAGLRRISAKSLARCIIGGGIARSTSSAHPSRASSPTTRSCTRALRRAIAPTPSATA